MKKFLLSLSLVLSVAAPSAFAEPAIKDAKKPAAKADAAPDKAARPLPMNTRADEIDANGMTFTQVTKDGRRVKHVVPAGASIKQGEADAKFTDIKVGDFVAGLRTKVSPTEYQVIKITKFGPRAAKPAAKKAINARPES